MPSDIHNAATELDIYPFFAANPNLILILNPYEDGETQKNLYAIQKTTFDALSESQKALKNTATLNYLRYIYNLPETAFKTSDKQDIPFLTLEIFHQTLHTQSDKSKYYVRRMPTDIVVSWIGQLQKKLDDLEEEPDHNQEKIETLKTIISTYKEYWKKQTIAIAYIKQALQKDSLTLHQVGLDSLANTAYHLDNPDCLHAQLPLSGNAFINVQKLSDSVHGRVFEQFLIYVLLNNFPIELEVVVEKMGMGLKKLIDEPFKNTRDKELFIKALQDKIRKDPRYWFSETGDAPLYKKTPEIESFLNILNPEKAYIELHKVLDGIIERKNKYSNLLLFYLGEIIYTEKLTILKKNNLLSAPQHQWIKTTEENYHRLNPSQSNNNQKITTRWLADLSNVQQPMLLQRKSEMPRIINLWLGIFAYFNTDLKLKINIEKALLSAIIYFNYDRVYYIQEILQIAYQRESFAANTIDKPYLHLNLQLLSPGQSAVSYTQFIADYAYWVSWYKEATLSSLFTEAEKQAWGNTLLHFEMIDSIKNQTTAPLPTKRIYKKNYAKTLAQYFIFEAVDTLSNDDIFIEIIAIFKDKNRWPYLGKNYLDAAKSLLDAVQYEKNLTIDKSAKARLQSASTFLKAIIKKENAEHSLFIETQKHTEFRNIQKSDLWRLMIDHNKKDLGQYGFENEPGYMAAMFNAFEWLLKTRSQRVTADYLEKLHDTAVSDVLHSADHEYFEQGYHNRRGWVFGLTLGDNATHQGLLEIKELYKEQALRPYKERLFTIFWQHTDKNNAPLLDEYGHFYSDRVGYIAQIRALGSRDKVKKIIDDYYQEIIGAKSNLDKLRIIVQFCRLLEIAHAFPDGNARTIGILLINKLLIQNGFAPTIFDNPSCIDAFSIDEVIREIEKGQKHFSGYQQSHITPTAPDENNESELIETEEADSALEHPQDKEDSTLKEIKNRYKELENKLFEEKHVDFIYGRAHFEEIIVPSTKGMTIAEIQALVVVQRESLTMQQLGALTYRLELLSRHVLLNEKIHSFTVAGAIAAKPLPPLRYQSSSGSKSYGLCYGMTWLIAIATLDINSEAAFATLSTRLYELDSNPDIKIYQHFKNAVIALHQYANHIYQQALVNGKKYQQKLTLSEIIEHLSQSPSGSAFEINTPFHTMPLMITGDGIARRYHFGDHFGLVTFDNLLTFQKALEEYFDHTQLVEYGAVAANDRKTIPQFEFEALDINAIKKIKIGVTAEHYLYIEELLQARDLDLTLKHKTQGLAEKINKTEKNIYLDQIFKKFNAEEVAKSFLQASQNLLTLEGKSNEYVPLLSSTKLLSPDNYRLTLIHRQTQEIIEVTTQDKRFIETQQYLDSHLTSLQQLHHGTEATTIDGINAGFLIQQLVTFFMQKSREAGAQQTLSASLATAITVHSYISTLQITHTTFLDFIHIKQIISSIYTAQSTASVLNHRIAAHVNTSLGLLFNGLFIGFDTYELIHAQSTSQKMIFSTQLICDTSGLIMCLSTQSLSWAGAATASTFISYLATPIAGISIGATALAQTYGQVADEVDGMCRYIEIIDQGYRQGGLNYQTDKKLFSLLPGVVIQHIDFIQKKITFGNHALYAIDTHEHGYANIGVMDKSHALSIWKGLEYSEQSLFTHTIQQALETYSANSFLLPSTPNTYLRPNYGYMLGIRRTQNTGAELLRRLENKTKNQRYQFLFEDFHFPYEHELRSFTSEYIATDIQITLSEQISTLYVPSLFDENGLPSALFGFLKYTLTGRAQNILLVLNEGVEIDISSSDSQTNWLLDTRSLKNNLLKIESGKLTFSGGITSNASNPHRKERFSGVTIYFNQAQQSKIKWITATGEIQTLDLENPQQTMVLSEDVNQWPQATTNQEKTYLDELSKAHRLKNTYTPINNYHDEHGQIIGRAFYFNQSTSDKKVDSQFIFAYWHRLNTDADHQGLILKLSTESELAGLIGDHAYFYHPHYTFLWQVNIKTGEILAQLKPNQRFDNQVQLHAWQEGNKIYLSYTLNIKEKYHGQFIYQLDGEQLTLISILYDGQSAQKWPLWETTDQISLSDLFSFYQPNEPLTSSWEPSGLQIKQASYAPLITVTALNKENENIHGHRYWISSNHQQQLGTVIRINLPTTTTSTDIMLVGILSAEETSTTQVNTHHVYYFFDYKNKQLYRQVNSDQDKHKDAEKLLIPNFKELLVLDSGLFILTNDYLLKQIDVNGKTHLAAIYADWLIQHYQTTPPTNWRHSLALLALEHNGPLPIMGLHKKGTSENIAVWYYQGHIVSLPSTVHPDSLFLGIAYDNQIPYLRLFDQANQSIYKQTLGNQTSPFIFSNTPTSSIAVDAPLATTPLFPGYRFQSAALLPNGIKLVTVDGEIFTLNAQSQLYLIGVTEAWQNNHQHTLETDLLTLSTRWTNAHSEVITLEQTLSTASPIWYHVSTQQIIKSLDYGYKPEDKLQYIGVSQSDNDNQAIKACGFITPMPIVWIESTS